MASHNLFTYAPNFADASLFTASDQQYGQNKCGSFSSGLSPSTNFVLENALQEILDQITRIEGRMATKELQQQISNRLKELEEQLHDVQSQIDNLVERLVPRGPVFLYTFVPYEKVQRIYLDNQSSPARFAVALEPIVYADEPWEMQVSVNKRLNSKDRIEFIQNCVFRHFNVPPALQEDVWRSVKAAMDNRSRRIRTSARSTPTTGFRTSTPILLDIQNTDYDLSGNN